MKTSILTFFFIATFLSFGQSHTLNSFTKISTSTNFKTKIVKSKEFKIEFENPEIEEKITYTVSDGLLKIESKRRSGWNWKWNNSIKGSIIIYTPIIKTLIVGGNGSVVSDNIWKSDSFKLKKTGNGTINFQFEGENGSIQYSGNGTGKIHANTSSLKAVISGNGGLRLSGKGDVFDFKKSGNGSLKAKDFITNSIQTIISGNGSSYLNCTQKIAIDKSGNGTTYVYGNPANVHKEKSGNGGLKFM